MLRMLALAATVGLIASPAFAQTAGCRQPYVPEASSSSAPTKLEIVAMRDDAKSFMEASDLYQNCLAKSAMASVTPAKISNMIEQNQRDKKAVGDRVNAAIAAFNAAQRAGVKISDASH